MSDLIRRGDALRAADEELRRYGFTAPEGRRFDMRDRLAALPARRMGVKPLVWDAYPIERFAGPDIAVADAPFNHRYQVQRDPWAQGYMAFLHPILPITCSSSWWESKGHPTLDAAKAAAQADYEARILAALAPTDAAQAREAALREAIERLQKSPAQKGADIGLALGNAHAIAVLEAMIGEART